MNNYDDSEKPIFDIDYCDENSIYSDWFKFDNRLVDYLIALVDEDTDNQGQWKLSDNDIKILAYTIYAILTYKRDGFINDRLAAVLNSKGLKLSKLAFVHAKALIDESRIKVAERRYNGKKGGRPPNQP